MLKNLLCISIFSIIPHFTALSQQNLQLSPNIWITMFVSNSIRDSATFLESDSVNKILLNLKRSDYITLLIFERFSSSNNSSGQLSFNPPRILMRYLNPENNLRLQVHFCEGEEPDIKSWLTGEPTPQLDIIYLQNQNLLKNWRNSFNALMEADTPTYILVTTG